RLDEMADHGLAKTIFFTEKISVCDRQGAWGGNLWAMPPLFASGTEETFNYGGAFGFTGLMENGQAKPAGALFQVQPRPGSCDPTLASSSHRGGINVAMRDGSVQFVTSNISQATWEGALKPMGIDKFPDWGD